MPKAYKTKTSFLSRTHVLRVWQPSSAIQPYRDFCRKISQLSYIAVISTDKDYIDLFFRLTVLGENFETTVSINMLAMKFKTSRNIP